MAQKVWRHRGLFFGHDRCSHAGNCIGLLFEHWQFTHFPTNKSNLYFAVSFGPQRFSPFDDDVL